MIQAPFYYIAEKKGQINTKAHGKEKGGINIRDTFENKETHFTS